jgi:hypothetical protein
MLLSSQHNTKQVISIEKKKKSPSVAAWWKAEAFRHKHMRLYARVSARLTLSEFQFHSSAKTKNSGPHTNQKRENTPRVYFSKAIMSLEL